MERLDAVDVVAGPQSAMHPDGRSELVDRRLARRNDVGVGQVEEDPKPEYTSRVGGDAAVAEIDPEEVDVRTRKIREPMSRAVATRAAVAVAVAARRRSACQPVGDGPSR
jgi:hypothetical protein